MQQEIKESEAGQRLDIWLATKFYNLSRHFLQKEIKEGRVLISSKIKKPSYRIKEGDLIDINLQEPKPFKLEANKSVKINVLFEDEDTVAVNKPAGVSVHPGTPPRNDTLVNGLLFRWPQIKDVGDNPQIRPGIVHRLDKDTSGVILIAKNQESFEDLKKQFKSRQIEKKYLALVLGHPKKSSGLIQSFIARSKSNPTKQTVVSKKTSLKSGLKKRIAKTKYRTKQEFKDYTLLECLPKTGRMHQIRVQLRFLGLPIVGDQKYGPKRDKLSKNLGRQFLHAQSICFRSLAGKKNCILAPLCKDLKETLRKIQ